MSDVLESDEALELATAFSEKIRHLKSTVPMDWYPHDIMGSFAHTADLVPSDVQDAWMAGDQRVIDVGPADGDLGYFHASRGSEVTFIDYPATNFNGCRGIAKLGEMLGFRGRAIHADVDFGVTIEGQYDLALCLGLIYHLRNPMLLLMNLAQHAERMLVSNRVTTHLPDGTDVSNVPLYYMLECRQSNNDPTNFHTMTPKAMLLTLKRSGWIVKASKIVGAEVSRPYGTDEDTRMFAYCERVPNWADLRKHHDF